MKKSKKNRWALSESGGAIFMLFLLGPLVIFGWLSIFVHFSMSPRDLIMIVLVTFLTLMFYGLSIAPLLRNTSLLSFQGLAEALFALSALFILWGSFVLVTGYTPTRFHSQPIPRMDCLQYYLRAIIGGVLGIISFIIDKHLKKQSPDGNSK